MKRRNFIQTLGATALSTVNFNLYAQEASAPKDLILGHGDRRYRVNTSWGKLDPEKFPIVNCHAMVQTKDGLLHTLCDGVRNNFLVYNTEGALQNAWGTEYPGAHGLELGEENGEEFFIVVDSGWMVRSKDGTGFSREQGRVVKITKEGKHVFTLGSPSTIGVYEPNMTYMPCDAAVAPNGDIYVADGYGSQWILQYDSEGKFIRKFGGPGKLNNAHGISVDTRVADKPMLVISSRGEQKLKWYSMDGVFSHEVSLPGALAGQCIWKGDYGYAGVCWSKENGVGKQLHGSGFVTILDKSNTVVSNPGGTAPEYVNGELQPMHQKENTFIHVHDVCVDTEENLYVLQWNAKGAYPIKLELIS